VKQQYSWRIFFARTAIKYSMAIDRHRFVDDFGVANAGTLIRRHALFLSLTGCSNQGSREPINCIQIELGSAMICVRLLSAKDKAIVVAVKRPVKSSSKTLLPASHCRMVGNGENSANLLNSQWKADLEKMTAPVVDY
jgi:hypothetical protein